MDDDFGGDFFENEDYGAICDDENFAEGGAVVGVGEAAQIQPVAAAERTTSEALVCTGELLLPPVKVVNTVCLFYTGCELDLRLLTISARNIEYNPRRVNAALIRFVRPRLTALIHPCGKISISGRATYDQVKHHAKLTAKICQKAGHPEVRFTRFAVAGIVCAAECGFCVRLENLSQDHAAFCSYEPETFCGVIYRYMIDDRKATVLIFVSGKLIITGCRTAAAADEVYKALYPVLYLYRK